MAWVNSLLARSPRVTRRSIARRSASSTPGIDAAGGEVTGLDELGEASLVLGGEQVDLADLAEVHAHPVGRRAIPAVGHPRRPAASAPAEQAFVGGVLGELLERQRDERRASSSSSVSSTSSSMRMPRLGQRVTCRFEDVAGELDVAQDEGDLFGVDRPGGATALGELGPLVGVDARDRQFVPRVWAVPSVTRVWAVPSVYPGLGGAQSDPGLGGARDTRVEWSRLSSPRGSLLHAAMEPT